MAATDTETTHFTPPPEGQEEKAAVAGEERTLILPTSAKDEPRQERVAKGVSAKHVLCVVVVTLTIMTQGTVTKGWTAVLPKMQDDPHGFTITDNDVAWLVSMTSIVGIFASLGAGPLVEWAGPRRVLIMAMALCTALWLLLAFPANKVMLFVARAGLATSVYVIVAVAMPLLGELSPSNLRGIMAALTEITANSGVLFGYLLAYLFTWQVATALCTASAGLLLLPLLLVPESPYWLVRRGRTEAARVALQRLTGSRTAAEDHLSAITSMSSAKQTSYTQQFTALAKGRNLRPVLLVLSFFVLRELGGRSCIMMYTVYIFHEAGVQLDALTCTVLVGVVYTVCPCLTMVVVERTGRRPVLAATAVVGGVALGVCGLFLHLQVAGASWVPLAAMLLYVAAYSIGIGPIPWVYVGELVPSTVRFLGASVITACDAVVVFTVSFGFLRIIGHIGLGVTFMAFAGFNLLIAVIVWLWIPESRGATLQDLEDAFSTKV